MRPFGPKPADHPSVGKACLICKRPFEAGDYTTLVATAPADAEEAAKMRAGRAYNSLAEEVCWEHAEAISFMTGEPITELPGERDAAR